MALVTVITSVTLINNSRPNYQLNPKPKSLDPLSSLETLKESPALSKVTDFSTLNISSIFNTKESLIRIFNENILGVKIASATLGRDKINPIYNIWDTMRSLSFLIIVLVLVVYGVLVMFRYKIDPRTVATAQAAIPRLAISLVAITFSFTVASFAIDLSQSLLGTVFYMYENVISTPSGSPNTPCLADIAPLPVPRACAPYPFKSGNLGGSGGFWDLAGILRKGVDLSALNIGISVCSSFVILGVDLCAFFNNLINNLPSWIAQWVLTMVFIQVFLMLVMRYGTLIIHAILGPLSIALGIIPGRSDSILRWLGNLMANALVFPGVYFAVNLAIYINNYNVVIPFPEPISGGDITPFVVLGIVQLSTKIPAVLEEAFNIVPSGHTGRAGTDLSRAAKSTPLIGSLLPV